MNKILFIDSMSVMGGGQHQIVSLINGFRYRYPDIEIISVLSVNNDIFLYHLKKMNIKSYQIHFGLNGYKNLLLKYYYSINTMWSIYKKLKKICFSENPDILYATDFKSAVYISLLKMRNIRKVYSIMSARNHSSHRLLDRFILNKMDGLIFNSTYTYNSYKSVLNKSVQTLINYSIVEKPKNFLNKNNLIELKDKLFNNQSYLVGFVGRIVPIKRIEDFIEMVRLLNNEELVISFIIIGEPDGHPKKDRYYLKLKKLIKHYKLSNISMINYKKNIYDYISIMDCLVLPTQGEGFGRVVIEAIFSETPVVATTPGGTDEILKDGNNGVLVSQCEPNELAIGVRSILKKQFNPKNKIPTNMTVDSILKNEYNFLSNLLTAQC